MLLITPLYHIIQDLLTLSYDSLLALLNLLTLKKKTGKVITQGTPGFKRHWPEYIAPREGDSRSSCPALNAMANHGLIPRNGRNISFTELTRTIHQTYNFADSFCVYVPRYMARILKKDYGSSTFDLEQFDVHNGIEHDASLTRRDSYFEPNQGAPHVPYVEELLNYASGKDAQGNAVLTYKDLALYSSKRRVDSRKENPEFSLSVRHKMFGSSNSATMIAILGGKVSDLKSFLIDERIPEGWEPIERSRFGMTLAKFNTRVLPLELQIDEKKYVRRCIESQ